MPRAEKPHVPQVGDLVQTRDIHGQAPRRGEIVEVLGEGAHERFRVRWDEQHESILYPADGVVIVPRGRRARRGQ